MLKNIDEENLNVPRGPEMVAETWRAWARLQIAVHTVFLWGHDLPATGVFYTTLSRITEKGSSYTAMVLQDVYDWLDSEGIMAKTDDITNWFDGGSSYKNLRISSFCAYHWPTRYGLTHKRYQTWRQKYGEPYHLKGKIDRFFGELENRMQAYETQFTIKGIEDVYEALTAPKRTATVEVFKILLPSETKDSWEQRHRLLVRKTLPAAIRCSNYYSWKLCEVRHGIVGRDGVSLTGIIARSHGLAGLPIDSALTRERDKAMQLQPCGVQDDADEEEEEGGQAAEEEEILTEAAGEPMCASIPKRPRRPPATTDAQSLDALAGYVAKGVESGKLPG